MLILIIGEIAFSFMDFKGWILFAIVPIFIILFFMLLVFNEIIELNFCGLQYDTKKNISKRALNEEMGDFESNYTEEEEDSRISNLRSLKERSIINN